MKKTRRFITTALVMILAAAAAFAASPSFSMKLNGALGAYNIQNNPTVPEVPGLSDNSKLDFSFGLRGSFGQEASLKGAGYNSGANIDVDALYRNYSKGGYSSSDRYSNNYNKIQAMIDWYEANKHYYGLPDNPFYTGEWPTGSYAEGTKHVEFINGTEVADINDIDWNSVNWAAAEGLYHDVKSHIEDVLYALYRSEGLAVGRTVYQDDYANMTPKQQELAVRKMEAINSFSALSGNHSAKKPASGFVEFTNLGMKFDIRADIGNARVRAGRLAYGQRSGQSAYGSSVRFGLTRDFIKGLRAGITLGVAGGMEQRPEQWDTQLLDFHPGKFAELALKLNADYTYEIPADKLAVTAGFDFVMPDLLVTPINNAGAIRLGVHLNDHSEYINEYGFYLVDPSTIRDVVEVKDSFEFSYVYTQDRYDRNDKASFACALRNEFYASAYGAEVSFDTAFKTKQFDNKYNNQVEDRFAGKNAADDYRKANLKSAVLFDLDLSFNTFRLLNTELFTINAGVDAVLYGGKALSTGFNTGIAFNFIDYVKHDLIVRADMSWYKNNLEKSWNILSDLPSKDFMDYTTISAGIEYEPYRNYIVGLNFVTAPSGSRKYTQRLTSVEATVSIKY